MTALILMFASPRSLRRAISSRRRFASIYRFGHAAARALRLRLAATPKSARATARMKNAALISASTSNVDFDRPLPTILAPSTTAFMESYWRQTP